jgi:uncharacterized protein YlxP (DUF503 family)
MIEADCQIAVLFVSLHIPHATSLKDKRMVIKSIKDKARVKFQVAVCEAGGEDKWQVATLAFCAVSNDNRYLDSCMQNILTMIQSYPEVEVCEHEVEFL